MSKKRRDSHTWYPFLYSPLACWKILEYHQQLQIVVLNLNLDLNIQNVESVWCRFSYFAGAFSTSREATKTVSLYTSTLNYLEAQHQNKPWLAPVLKLYSRTFKATPLLQLERKMGKSSRKLYIVESRVASLPPAAVAKGHRSLAGTGLYLSGRTTL